MGALPLGPWLLQQSQALAQAHPELPLAMPLQDVFELLKSLDAFGLRERITQEHPHSVATWWFEKVAGRGDHLMEALNSFAKSFKWPGPRQTCDWYKTKVQLERRLEQDFPLALLSLSTEMELGQAVLDVAWLALERSGLLCPMTDKILTSFVECYRR